MGRTKVIKDNLNPKWVESFEIEYQFEQQENYKVFVYDVDDLKHVKN